MSITEISCTGCETAGWVLRHNCGPWHPVMIEVYKWSSLAIHYAYLAIPLFLFLASRSETSSPARLMTQRDYNILRYSFAVFILVCGVGHLEGFLSFYWVNYHFWALWHLGTAIISWWTVFWVIFYRSSLLIGV